eukprot:CAMPEP_0170583086 /NCGR_PEP_ID=MMETSP0224-20130122/7939_1 /TAXON_ID=285029 /ORGANISM="Togula jolla, Strain CCCM 725" /LENGTH=683 /DNA_ID=CAMNT_0010906373 /DNA_START=255 /DNA_END=2306 /DNA_ORIENTATION=-
MGLLVEAVDDKSMKFWQKVDIFFICFFVTESGLKAWALGESFLDTTWHSIDVAISVFAFIDFGLSFMTKAGPFTFVTALMRCLRLGRMFELLPVKAEAKLIVASLGSSLTSIAWLLLVFVIALYACAVLCTGAFRGASERYTAYYAARPLEQPDFDPTEAFGSIGSSLLTLYSMILVAEWSEIVRPTFHVDPAMAIFFVAFSFLFICGLLNVVIGIFCETVARVHQRHQVIERERQQKEQIQQVEAFVQKVMNADGGGALPLNRETFESRSGDAKLQEVMEAGNFPRDFQVSDVYDILDTRGQGFMSHGDFMRGISRLVYETDFQRKCSTELSLNRLFLGMGGLKVSVEQCLKAILEVQRSQRELEETPRRHGTPVSRERSPAPSSTATYQGKQSSRSGRSKTVERGHISTLENASSSSTPHFNISDDALAQVASSYDGPLSQTSGTDGGGTPVQGPSYTDVMAIVGNSKDNRGAKDKSGRSDKGSPLRKASLEHSKREFERVVRELAQASVPQSNGSTQLRNGMPADYWAPGPNLYSRQEERVMVWSHLLSSAQKESAGELKRWLAHAVAIGIDPATLELEMAYCNAVASRSIHEGNDVAPAVSNALERGDWLAALELVSDASIVRGAVPELVANAHAKLYMDLFVSAGWQLSSVDQLSEAIQALRARDRPPKGATLSPEEC